MSSRSLNGLSNVFVNTLNSGDAINIVSSSSTSQSTIDLKISKQDTQSTFEDTDMIVIETASGNIKKVLASVVKDSADGFFTKVSSNIYPDATSENLLLGTTSNSNSRKLLVLGDTELQDLYLQSNKKIISSNDSNDYLLFGNNTFTNNYTSNIFTNGISFGTTADLILATGRNISRANDSNDKITFNSGNFTFGNTGIFNNGVEVKSTTSSNSGSVSFFEASNNGTSNIDLHAPETLTHDYNAYLPQITDTNITSVYILSNKNVLEGTNINISNSSTDTITVNMDTTITGTITFSSTISGSINGNAETSTKIASITNSNIVQLTEQQTLTNKTFNDLTIFNNGLAVKQSASNTSGNVRFFDDNNSHFIDLHIQNETVASDLNLFLPNDIDNSVLVGTINTQTLTNKTLSTGTVYNGNTIAVNYGGTGLTSYTSGNILYASGTTTLSKLEIGSNNRFLMSNGSAPVWALGYSVSTPLTFTGLEIGINGLSGYGSNNQIITTTGSALAYSSTLTSVALSSCSGNISQFTNDSNYLTSITTPLTTATNFGTSAGSSVEVGNVNRTLVLTASSILLDYTKPIVITIINAFTESNLISTDGSNGMIFGNKGTGGYNSALQSNTILNLSLSNSAYSIDLNSTTSQIQYNAPLHNFQTGLIKTQTKGIFVGNDNTNALNTEIGINHSASTANGISFLTCFLNENQIGDVRQQTNNSVSFNTSSDYRLKTNIETINCLELIKKLKVKKFNFKSDLDIDIVGFIAHEVQETDPIFNSVVNGKKDEMCNWDNENKCWTDSNNENCQCKPKFQSIDYGKLTPFNTRAIQELYAIIQQQQIVINNLLSSSSFKEFKSK